MRLTSGAIALLLAAMAPAGAQAGMSVNEFLARAEKVQKRGMLGMMSSEARPLGKEIGDAADALRAEQTAALAAGRTPPACPPPKGKAKFTSGELLAYLHSLPPARRDLPFRAAFYGFAARKYPCPA